MSFTQIDKKTPIWVKLKEIGTRSSINLTMITTYGFATSIYNETVPVKLNMDCLFG